MPISRVLPRLPTELTDIMTNVGKYYQLIEGLETQSADLKTDIDACYTQLESDGYSARAGALQDFARQVMESRNREINNGFKQLAWRIFQEYTTSAQLGIPTTSEADYFPELIRLMVAGSQSIKSCTVSVGSPTYTSQPTGASIVFTTVLDGYQPPGDGYAAVPSYSGQTSQFVLPDVNKIACYDSKEYGHEYFHWWGLPKFRTLGNKFGDSFYGGGLRAEPIRGGFAGNVVRGAEMSYFSGNRPTGANVITGTLGTHILEDTTEYYHFDRSLKYVGDGSLAAIELRFPTTGVTPLTRYCLSFRYKADSSVSAGTLEVAPYGTGYTPGGSESVSIAHGSLATSWTLQQFWFNTPSVVPDDFAISIKWGSTPTNTKRLWISGLSCKKVDYHQGIGATVIAGQANNGWGINSGAAFLTENNFGGKAQRFFVLGYGYQLPHSGSPTIADTLFGGS